MSLYGTMRTGVSGMNAQANRLSTVAENVANSSTVGYKRASTEFSSMILPSSNGSYNSGGVETSVRYSISDQGSTTYTTSASDLAIDGDGFFIVQGANGQEYLTRAGAFVQDDSGNLVNAAGFTLMGYEYEAGVDPTVVVNGFDGLTEVNLASQGLTAAGSTEASMGANLPSGAANGDVSTTSLIAFDTQGNSRILDFNYTKTGDNAWSLEVLDRTTGTSLGTQALDFDTSGALTTSPSTMTISGSLLGVIAGTGAELNDITLDFTETTQLGTSFTPDGGEIDGNAPSKVSGYQIDTDGVVYIKYANGELEPRYRIALANVQSPDKLVPESGNVYSQGVDSGVIVTGFAGSGSFGEILSGALESSNVDIADELTSMIESQRNYTANSKVFQTGSELLEVLVNLKR
ncbi:flagellar biosynthesis protein FlgE [Sinorhizobium glycinis]|uniref:Flagellar hook protein FlgE n=1 Tax=Sinorhizobium glycinis TaxID=1472378 RepID=A0A178Y0E3_9HYPH|nr:flagellar hook protein FlgE [Sinorhizobium glycinis]OAP41049.1 flagellar biosynthesis protein FlgE [Sinorhizobium glycinis]